MFNSLPTTSTDHVKLPSGRSVSAAAPWPYFSEDEIDAAVKVLRSGKTNYRTGNEGQAFEREFAEFVGCKHGIALANGTLALELALYALDIGSGDEVITTARTFIASASAVVMRGATPVFADVDPNSQNLTAETIRAALTPKTKAIILVHLAGWPCDMDPIMALAKEHDLKIIEDCAQAHGATYKGQMVGSFGEMAAFSFCQDKIMTTAGEGGMLLLNDTALYEKAWAFKDHGKSYREDRRRSGRPTQFRWLHESFGTNWRISEVQSAVGRAQLRKLPGWITRRREHAALLRERLSRWSALRIPQPDEESCHAYYKFYVFVKPEELAPGWNRDRIIEAIYEQGKFCQSGSCSEVYLEKAFDASGLTPQKRLRIAKRLGETSLMFLVHPTLLEQDITETCDVVDRVMREASRHASQSASLSW